MSYHSFKPPGRSSLRTSVFDLESKEERDQDNLTYKSGIFTSIFIYNWTTPSHRKWFGLFASLRCTESDDIILDAKKFEDYTIACENENRSNKRD